MGDFHKLTGELSRRLLDWYAVRARDLPWRVGPGARAAGRRPDPYHVWLSEIMLQQTTIPHATRYFHAFIARWPHVEDLAAAEDGEVMSAWAGLGYYARARNLLKCARAVAARGAFPDTVEGLRALPGVGPYTAGAVAALAFDRPAAAVDGNVERVFSRLMALDMDWAQAKRKIAGTVAALVPRDQPGAFAEALMDLGATVCTPRRPDCRACPLEPLCAAHAQGQPERYPIKPAKRARPVRRGTAFVLVSGDAVLLERRPDKGLLGGMLGLPTTPWTTTPSTDPTRHAPAAARWEARGQVRHVFTHFALDLDVWRGTPTGPRPEGLWYPIQDAIGLPSLFAKALRLAHLQINRSQ